MSNANNWGLTYHVDAIHSYRENTTGDGQYQAHDDVHESHVLKNTEFNPFFFICKVLTF